MLKKKSTRDGILKIIKLFFAPQLFIYFLIEGVYFSFIIFTLWKIGYWEIGYLKDTIKWFIFVGSVITFNYSNLKKEGNFFRNYLKKIITFGLLFEFIVNFHTYSLIVEIFLIPIITTIVISKIMIDKKDEYKILIKPFNYLEAAIGLMIIYSGFKNIYDSYNQILNEETLKSFFLTPLMMILYLPFAYILILVVEYESIFIRLGMGNKKSRKIKLLVKYFILKECLWDLNKLREVKSMGLYNIMSIETRKDVDAMRLVYKENFK
ncbi:MAG: hypothetical protein WBG30_03355 [Psychrilyobacter sp.]